MSTRRYYWCAECHQQTSCGYLLDALRSFPKSAPRCKACQGPLEFHLVFNFGLGAASAKCRVLHVSAPAEDDLESWISEVGETVTFFPFLVVLAGTDKKEGTDKEEGGSVWLPYWHTVEKDGVIQRKYGQFAPFIDDSAFKSLLDQAKARGFLC